MSKATGGIENTFNDYDDEMLFDCLYPFTPGYVYVADATGFVVGEYKSMEEAKLDAKESDIILLAYNSKGSKVCLKPEPKCNKIVIDFDKKELTIGDRDVTIDKLIYEKDSIYDLDITMLTQWQELLEELRKVADSVEVLGTPPILGKDITNEMSDL